MPEINPQQLFRVNGDILATLICADEVGWDSITELSIQRIMYISSVLFSFKNEKEYNPFEKDYNFSISLRGPFSSIISYSLINLLSRGNILVDGNKEVRLSTVRIDDLESMPFFLERKDWIENIVYILAIYGEEKIYDFIFRDPEYQDTLQRNSVTEINLKIGNETYLTLKKMKAAFENSLEVSVDELENKKYLDMYFDYVFSKILRGETE